MIEGLHRRKQCGQEVEGGQRDMRQEHDNEGELKHLHIAGEKAIENSKR